MANVMKRIATVSLLLSLLLSILFRFRPTEWILSAFITCFTVAYHFLMRLVTGGLYNKLMKNRADPSRKWYQTHPVEHRLYQWLQVKRWKRHMPSYDPTLFDPALHTWDEIAQAMCQAELVHETIAVLSFAPLLFSLWWGAFPTFLITSICAALLDSAFAIMQRYNRPRILKLAQKARKKAPASSRCV